MSRTRGASNKYYLGDGEVTGKGGEVLVATRPAPIQPARLDRQGNYISPAASQIDAPRNIPANVSFRGPGAEPVPVAAPITGYRCDKNSLARSIEAWDLFQIIDLAMGGLKVDVTPEQFQSLPGDVRRHFVSVRSAAPKGEENAA